MRITRRVGVEITPAMEETDEEGLKLFEKLGGAEASGVERRAAAIEMLLSQAAK